MRHHVVFLVMSFFSIIGYAQTSIDWRSVKLIEYVNEWDSSIEICGGEWAVRARANSMEELNSSEQKRIKKKLAEAGCLTGMVDVKNLTGPIKGKIYFIGIKKKEDQD
ncbi:MAG: hypothetical protein MRZ79_12985 [Bacteroidia bacterium]|nr:hypothetical protein [Bacteroidia bacterium]